MQTRQGKMFSTFAMGAAEGSMSARATTPEMKELKSSQAVSLGLVTALLDTLDKPVLVAERNGRIVLATIRARQGLETDGQPALDQVNLFALLGIEAKTIRAPWMTFAVILVISFTSILNRSLNDRLNEIYLHSSERQAYQRELKGYLDDRCKDFLREGLCDHLDFAGKWQGTETLSAPQYALSL